MAERDPRQVVMLDQQAIVTNYRRTVGALEVMFREIDKRTVLSRWRGDGVGSCTVSADEASRGFAGRATWEILRLRRERDNMTGGPHVRQNACDYHRANVGCVLGDLKSPACIGYVDNHRELWNRFRIEARPLERDIIYFILDAIQRGERRYWDRDGEFWDVNDQFVENALDAIGKMTNHIRSFPVLSQGGIGWGS